MYRFAKVTILACGLLVIFLCSAAILKGQAPAEKGKTKSQRSKTGIAKSASVQQVVEAPLMERPVPGSDDDKRMKAFQSQIAAGLVKTVVISDPPKEDLSKGVVMPNFRATEIAPDPKAKGEMLAFQQKLTRAFAANDHSIPVSRIAHFAWLRNHPNVRIYGWKGYVTGAQLQEDASVIMTVKFHPWVDTGTRAVVLDYVTEKYHVANGVLHLIDTDAEIHNPSIQVVYSF